MVGIIFWESLIKQIEKFLQLFLPFIHPAKDPSVSFSEKLKSPRKVFMSETNLTAGCHIGKKLSKFFFIQNIGENLKKVFMSETKLTAGCHIWNENMLSCGVLNFKLPAVCVNPMFSKLFLNKPELLALNISIQFQSQVLFGF